MSTEKIEEPKVKKKKLPVRDFWKRNRVVGEVEVSSGPPPTFDELPPVDPKTGEPVEGTQGDFLEKVDEASKEKQT